MKETSLEFRQKCRLGYEICPRGATVRTAKFSWQRVMFHSIGAEYLKDRFRIVLTGCDCRTVERMNFEDLWRQVALERYDGFARLQVGVMCP